MSNPIPRQEYIRSGTVESLNVTGDLKYQGVPFVPSAATDEKAKVSSNDTTPGYLDGKLVAGSGITLTQNNDGGNGRILQARRRTVVRTELRAQQGLVAVKGREGHIRLPSRRMALVRLRGRSTAGIWSTT